jgi:hypothetical protein
VRAPPSLSISTPRERQPSQGAQHRATAQTWSTYGAKRSQPVATGRKCSSTKNGRNKRKPLPLVAARCRSKRMVRRGSTLWLRRPRFIGPFATPFWSTDRSTGLSPHPASHCISSQPATCIPSARCSVTLIVAAIPLGLLIPREWGPAFAESPLKFVAGHSRCDQGFLDSRNAPIQTPMMSRLSQRPRCKYQSLCRLVSEGTLMNANAALSPRRR